MLAEFILTYICGFMTPIAILFIASIVVTNKKN